MARHPARDGVDGVFHLDPLLLQLVGHFAQGMLGLGDRLATAQVSALLQRGLVVSDTPYGKLRFGVPQHALRFYFPALWPEAEAG